VIKLTVTGRTSGLPRTVCISAMPVDGGYVVFSGFGIRSNWYRNLRANPEATIRVGRQTHSVVAEMVQNPERRRNLMIRMRDQSGGCGPPLFIRPLLRLTRAFDYDAELEMAVEHGRELPVVMLRLNGEV
jgi:deazaflavin-dependent oxidoreductase (nitroreductase family)